MALTARGPELAGWRPHPTGVSLANTRSWLPHLPLFRALRPGCPGRGLDRPRELLWARVPARTLAQNTRHVRHRPAPLSRAPPACRRLERDPGPVAGFARHSQKSAARQRNRVGHRLPRKATLTFARPAGGIPSHLARNVRDPSGSGSAPSLAQAGKPGTNAADFSGKCLELLGLGCGNVHGSGPKSAPYRDCACGFFIP